MRKTLIAALIALGPAAAAQAPQGVNPNQYLRDQLTQDRGSSNVQQIEQEICIEIVGDHESVARSQGWRTITETSTDEQLTVLFSKGRQRERMTCYRDQLIVDKWRQR